MRKNVRLFLVILFIVCVFLPVCGSAAPPVETGSGFIVVASAPAADFYTSTPSGTIPLRVSFFDRSEGTLPLSYLWDFGDGSTSRDQNPTHTYGAPGRYTVTLRVKNAFGEDTKVLPGFIAVGYPPVVDFSVSVPKGNVPLVVSFTDWTNGTPDSWNWDFGDGTTSREQNPTHAYTQAGIFSVTLFSGNKFGTGQITKSGMINTGVVPETEFAAETRQGDPPLTVRFHDFTTGQSRLHGHGISGMDPPARKKTRSAYLSQKKGGIPHRTACHECIWQ